MGVNNEEAFEYVLNNIWISILYLLRFYLPAKQEILAVHQSCTNILHMKWCYYIQKRKPPSLTQKSLRSVLRSSATTYCSRESPLESSNIQPLLQAPLQAAAQNPHSRRLAVKPNTLLCSYLCSPLGLASAALYCKLTTAASVLAAVVQRPGFSA